MRLKPARKFTKHIGVLGVGATVIALSACGGDPQADGATADDVVLSVVTPFPAQDDGMKAFFMMVDRLEEDVEGLTIDYRGGPDAMDPFDLAEAVQNGTIDMTAVPTAYYEGLLPWVAGMELLAPLDPSELRSNGIWDLLEAKHREDLGVQLIAETKPLLGFQLYLNEEVRSVEDLEGLRIRVAGRDPMIEALGAHGVQMPGGEIYTAMERGVVDGFRWTSTDVISLGLPEVTSYELLPPYYVSSNPMFVNAATWDAMPSEMQDQIMEVATAVEMELVEFQQNAASEEREERREMGMEVIELDPDEAERFLAVAIDAKWESVLNDFPELQELRDLYDAAMAGR